MARFRLKRRCYGISKLKIEDLRIPLRRRNEVFLFFRRCHMKSTWIFTIAFALACGCASTESVDMPEKMPRLIEQEPFPPMSEALLARHSELDLRILIAEDGSVLKAELLNPINDAAWDALASEQIKQWKFSPAMHNGKPVSMWINFHAHVNAKPPVYIGLAEIECGSTSISVSRFGLRVRISIVSFVHLRAYPMPHCRSDSTIQPSKPSHPPRPGF